MAYVVYFLTSCAILHISFILIDGTQAQCALLMASDEVIRSRVSQFGMDDYFHVENSIHHFFFNDSHTCMVVIMCENQRIEQSLSMEDAL